MNLSSRKNKKGFSLIELLIVIGIIGILATIIFTAGAGARRAARDAKRKADVAQAARLLSANCYIPYAGAGTYDLKAVAEELAVKYPQYASYLSNVPIDPSGNSNDTRYKYIVDMNGKCALFADLENGNENVTLPNIAAPTPGGGTGVLKAPGPGWNGTDRYFQVSN